MTIKVRFFARLREQIGHAEMHVPETDVANVLQVWQLCTQQQTLPANVLTAVNMTYVSVDHPVRNGDEVAFFPPVTGG